MNKIILFLLFISYISCHSQLKQIIPIHNDTILADNNIRKLNPFKDRFLLTGEFIPVKKGSDIKLAKVLTSTGWGLIDEKGQIIIPTQYTSISDFKNGLATVSQHIPSNSKNTPAKLCYSMINGQGKTITPKCFSTNSEYSSDSGEGFTHLRIKNTSKLADGLVKVCIGRLISIYNEQGEQIIPAEYSEISFSGQYFIARKETPNSSYDIYDINAKKIRSVDAVSVYITGDLAIIRNNRKEHVEDLITGKKYFENKFHTMSALTNNDDLAKDIILVGSRYADTITYSSPETITYINKDFEMIQNKKYSKSPQRYAEDQIRAENPENNDIAILNSKGEVLYEYTRKEYLNYVTLDSDGYQNTENLQENLIKYHHLWSKYDRSRRAIDLGDILTLQIYDYNKQKIHENIFIQKKNGKILYRIKKNINYVAIHPNKKFLIGYITNQNYTPTSGIITDTKGTIIKTAKKGQFYQVINGHLFVGEGNYTYPADQHYNPIYQNKVFTFEKIQDTQNYVGISLKKTEIYNDKGKVIQTVGGLTHSLYPNELDRSIPQDNLTLITDRSYSIFSKETWKPILQFNFKSEFYGYIEGGIFVHEQYEDGTRTHTYIDPYMNIVKIIY